MLRKVMTYTDFDGNERTEEFFFNLSKAELVVMEGGVSGGLSEMLKRIVAQKDVARLIEEFQRIILLSYGEKSPDGKHFVKSKELSDKFSQTTAYSDLFMELVTNADAATDFVKGLVPGGLG